MKATTVTIEAIVTPDGQASILVWIDNQLVRVVDTCDMNERAIGNMVDQISDIPGAHLRGWLGVWGA